MPVAVARHYLHSGVHYLAAFCFVVEVSRPPELVGLPPVRLAHGALLWTPFDGAKNSNLLIANTRPAAVTTDPPPPQTKTGTARSGQQFRSGRPRRRAHAPRKVRCSHHNASLW